MTTPAANANEQRERNLATIRQYFQFMHEKDIARWGTLWDEHGRILTPYPVAGFPPKVEGKAQIVAGFEQLFAGFVTYDSQVTQMYPTLDPDVIVVEWSVSAELRATGKMYQSDNITVFKFQQGRISENYDYFNPEKFQVVIDAMKASS